MAKKILVDAAYPQETRVVLLNDNNNIEQIEYETSNKHQIKGNIYLAKIVRVEPSLQAAFIDFGNEKNGFLPFSEIHPVYYHIPASDRDIISAELQSINRPELSSDEGAEQEERKNINVPDEELLSLDGDMDDEIEQEESNANEDSEDLEEKKAKLYNQYKIQDVIKKGQIILVQAQKEPRGNKGASFSSFISLAGKYCVLMPNSDGSNGISRKIANSHERKRLRSIVDEIMAPETKSTASLILRTAGVKKTTYEIKRDYDYLVRLWNKIRDITLKSTAPAFIHMEEDILHKTIRDIFDHNVKEILVQGSYAFSCAHEIMHNMLPSEVSKVVEYKAKTPIFSKFNVEEQLSNLYQPISTLSSGGYIVINPTEALISIDVNSGKATSERNIEETAFRTNIEAAKEIARQLRLRDLSGLVVVDFIDMMDSKNRRNVERTFREALSTDRARIQMGNISTFGLLEMSRQRLRHSFLEANTKMCEHCNGKGIVRADESNAMLILRTIEQEIFNSTVNVVNVFAHVSSVIYLLNNKRQEIKVIEEKYNIRLNFFSEDSATSDSFAIEKVQIQNTLESKEAKPALSSSANLFENAGSEEAPVASAANPEAKRKNKKWGNRKRDRKPLDGNGEEIAVVATVSPAPAPEPAAPVEQASEAAASDQPTAAKKPNRRRVVRKKPAATAVAPEAKE